MLNMMYRNGTFSKRYGQEVDDEYTYPDKIYDVVYFKERLIVHSGANIYINGVKTQIGGQYNILAEETGEFIKFYQTLFYRCNGMTYEYKYDIESSPAQWKFDIMKPYVPDIFTECQPQKDGDANRQDTLNLLTLEFSCVYNSDNTTDYYPYGNDDDIIDWGEIDGVHKIKVKVNDVDQVEGTDYSVDAANKKITFLEGHVPPSDGIDNVKITFTMKPENLQADRERLNKCSYHINYGANGSSHLFLAGGGDSKIFYSDSYDATYFPEDSWIIIGSTEQDVTGFGMQYNVLIAFKPKEIYSLYSYQTTASMVTNENQDLIGTEAFGSTIVNADMGCDCPHTIQLINNQITWFSSVDGVCTLVSTNISDERNVRVLSRNINRKNNFGVIGILDYGENLENIVSIDYDYKYFLVFPEAGACYMWDYSISPFVYTSSKVTDPKSLDWFLFDNFYVKQFVKVDSELKYVANISKYEKTLIKLTQSLNDLDFNDDGEYDGITAYYMTPLLQFGGVEYLKNVKNIYVQCRGDTSSVIDMYYFTDETSERVPEPETIRIGGKLWAHFTWNNFQWLVINWANTFRRKCGLKKVQMASFYFENKDTPETSVAGRDMSINHISIDYQILKAIK